MFLGVNPKPSCRRALVLYGLQPTLPLERRHDQHQTFPRVRLMWAVTLLFSSQLAFCFYKNGIAQAHTGAVQPVS